MWLFGSGVPRPRSKHGFQVFELVSFSVKAGVFHLFSPRSWHVFGFFLRSTRQRLSSRVCQNFVHWGTQSWRDLFLDQCRDQQGLLFGSGEPRLCSDQWLQDFEAPFIDVQTGVLHPSFRRSWHFLEMFLLSARQRVAPNNTSEFSHRHSQSGHDVHLEQCLEHACGFAEAVNQSCPASEDSKTSNTFLLMYTRELLTRVHSEVGTSWVCAFTVRGFLQISRQCFRTSAHGRAMIFILHNAGDLCVTASPVSAEWELH